MAVIQDSQRRPNLRTMAIRPQDNSTAPRADTKVRLTRHRQRHTRLKGKATLQAQAVILRREATRKLDRTRTADQTVPARLKALATVGPDLGLPADSDHHTMLDSPHEQAQ